MTAIFSIVYRLDLGAAIINNGVLESFVYIYSVFTVILSVDNINIYK